MNPTGNTNPSKKFRTLLIICGSLALLLIVFEVGVFVGIHKGGFSYDFGRHYDDMFGPNQKNMMAPEETLLPGSHGAAGTIEAIDLPTIIIVGQDNVEKTVLVTASTSIQELRGATSSEAMKVGDSAIVIGSPDKNSAIHAYFIRIIPTPSSRQ